MVTGQLPYRRAIIIGGDDITIAPGQIERVTAWNVNAVTAEVLA
jgi:hypothetical protein